MSAAANILCIETSAARGSVAVQCGEQSFDATIDTPRTQTEQLIPQIDAVLARAGIGLRDLAAIGFGCGPGSFIGVRLAAAVAQGLAAATGIALAPVSSMAVLAGQFASRPDETAGVVVCLDARMGEVYLASYAAATPLQAREALLAPHAVELPDSGRWLAAGSGFAAYPQLRDMALARGFEVFQDVQPHARDALPLARAMLERGELIAAERWQGRYLRGETAWRTQQ